MCKLAARIMRPALSVFVLGCGSNEPSGVDPDPPTATSTLNCTNGNPACPELAITGDAPARLPDGRPSPARGFADPSFRKDPSSTTIWLAYSWPYMQFSAAGTAVGVDSRLARSDDNGASWRFVRELWKSVAAIDELGNSGWINSEVVSLAPRATGGATVWYSVRLRYFTRAGGSPKVSSFTLRIASAATPENLATADEATLGGDLTHAFWRPDTNLAALSTELAGCTWNDPALLHRNNTLYLAVQCSLFATSVEPVEREFIAVFSTQPSAQPKSWSWRYLGKLAGYAEAVELGGEILQQTDLAVGADGQLLAIFSPSKPDTPLAAHFGCAAVEVQSLEPPRLARDSNNKLRIRARITATDLLPSGPGACGYDAASATGLVIVRRIQEQNQLVVSLHRTGIKP